MATIPETIERGPYGPEHVIKITATRTGLPRGVRFAAALAILGGVMFAFPKIALPLGAIVVLGALMSSGANPAAPIDAFGKLIYGG